MNRLLLLATLCAACGASTRKCKSGTVFATVSFDAASAVADSLDIVLQLDGAPSEHNPVARKSGAATSTVEIDFDKYPSGGMLDITLVASAGPIEVGRGHLATALAAGCTSLSIAITGENVDLAGVDFSGLDFATVDLAGADLAGVDFSGVDLAVADLAINTDLSTPDLTGCPYIYVSPTGTLGNSGCSPATSVPTITNAMSIAAGKEVHVCAGTYPEQNLLVTGVIRGGYSCTAWLRTATFGYPTFDGANETIITNGNYPSSTITLTDNTAGTVIEGFTIKAPASGATASTTVLVSKDATVSNNKILGGGTSSASGTGSMGLEIAGGSGDFFNNLIDGGSGPSSSGNFDCSSLGLFVGGSGTPHIHDNTLNGGSGAGTNNAYGSCAVDFEGTGSLVASTNSAFERNLVNGGTGQSSGGGQSSWGLIIDIGAQIHNLDLVDNQIDGGAPADAKYAQAIYSGNQGTLTIQRNRIYGGSGIGTTGITQNRTNTTVIDNNMIHLGAVGAGQAIGVNLASSNATVRHNTIVLSNSATSTVQAGIDVQSGRTGAVIENNLIGGSGGTGSVAVETNGASGISSLKNNLTFFATIFSDNGTLYTSDQTMEGTDSFATGNLNLSKTSGKCTGDSGCIPTDACDTGPDCLATIFGAWETTTNGKSNLLGTGWKLVSAVPCAVSKSSLNDIATVPLDLFKTARTNPPSMGAHEYDGTCQ